MYRTSGPYIDNTPIGTGKWYAVNVFDDAGRVVAICSERSKRKAVKAAEMEIKFLESLDSRHV